MMLLKVQHLGLKHLEIPTPWMQVTYAVNEDAFAGYTASYSGDSDASGNITLAPGDNKTVTITNNDNAVPQQKPHFM